MSRVRTEDRRSSERRSYAPRPDRDPELRRAERRTGRTERRCARNALRATEAEIQALLEEAHSHPGGFNAFFEEETARLYAGLED